MYVKETLVETTQKKKKFPPSILWRSTLVQQRSIKQTLFVSPFTSPLSLHLSHTFILHHFPYLSLSLAVSESGPITEQRDEQLLCVQSSDDGVIQQKSNRQRPSLSLHLFLHLCLSLSLLFLFSLCESWTDACHRFGSLLVLFLDNRGCSLYILRCKH